MLQMSDCASLYAAVPSNFLQMRSLIGQNCHFLHFSLLFPLKSFSLLFWASQNVTASMLLLCYYTGNEIYSWKSLNPKGDIHLHESTQLERKTWLNLSSLVQKRTESCDSIVSVTVFKLHQFLNCHISLHFLSKGLIHEV